MVVHHHHYANPPAEALPYVGWEVPGLGGRRPIDRPDLTAELIGYLKEKTGTAVGVTTALHGAGGFGKTTLATYVCSGQALRERFPGGLLWVTLGQDKSGAELLSLVNDLCARLGGRALGTLQQAGSHLGSLLDQHPPILLVLDDVWEETALGPFMIGGERCTRLITTRIPTVIPDGAHFVRVDQMGQQESVEVLAAGLPGMPLPERRRLLELTGRWPLLLGLVNAQLLHAVHRGDSLPAAAAEAVRRLSEHGPAILDVTRSSARSRAVDATVRASMDLLCEGSRDRYKELAIFAEDVDISFDVISTLWRATAGYDERAVVRAVEEMVDLSLFAAYRFTGRSVRLHDVLRQYLRHLCGDDSIRELNTAFLRSNQTALRLTGEDGRLPWWALPDDCDYLWQHLAYHLAESENTGQLETLLTDLRWLVEKSRRYGVAAVEADLARIDTLLAAGLKAALGRDAHVLEPVTKDPSYPAVIVSRLTGIPELSEIITQYQTSVGPGLATIENFWSLPDQSAALVRVITDGMTQISGSRLSPDARYVATVGAGWEVTVWSRDTGQRLYTLSGHLDAVTDCVFSTDQLTLYTTSSDGTVRVWDLLTRQQRTVLTGHTARVNGCALSADGSMLVTVSDDRTARVWDTSTGAELLTFGGHSDRVLSGAFSPDGRWMLTTGADGQLRRWATATGAEIEAWTGHLGMTTSCAVAPDGSWFVTSGEDEMVRVWNVSTPRVFAELPGHRGRVNAVAISPSGDLVVSGGDDRTIRVWDASRRTARTVLYGHSWYVTDCKFSNDGRWLLSAGWDKSARLWDTSFPATDLPEPAARARTTSCASTSSGDLLLTGTRGGELQLWSVEQRTHRTLGRGAAIMTADLSPDGAYAVTADSAGRLTVWEVATGTQFVLVPQTESRIERCRFSSDGRQIVAGAQNGTVTVWAWPEGTVTQVFSGHDNWVADCAFSPDGLWLVSVDWDSIVQVGRVAGAPEPFKLSSYHRGPIHCCAITPSGGQLVTGGADGQLHIWSFPSGVLTATVRAHTSAVRACAISHDGSYLLTGGDDASVRVWTWGDFTNIASMQVAGPIVDVVWCGPDRKLCVVGDVGVHVFRLAQHPAIPHARRPLLRETHDSQESTSAGANTPQRSVIPD
ncbi:NB-ARC domain-containing protein [Micromonospora sp. NPDC049004]|uniref:NB-ARC domain-containing protein n=1 Tax=Micromonospora sp. NPDC049004 TaxID=3154348 RepID=UPI0033EF82A7